MFFKRTKVFFWIENMPHLPAFTLVHICGSIQILSPNGVMDRSRNTRIKSDIAEEEAERFSSVPNRFEVSDGLLPPLLKRKMKVAGCSDLNLA